MSEIPLNEGKLGYNGLSKKIVNIFTQREAEPIKPMVRNKELIRLRCLFCPTPGLA